MSGKAAVMRCERACVAGSVLAAKKRLEASGREDGGIILLSPSLATSGPESLLVFFFFLTRPEPAPCAKVWVIFGAQSGWRMAGVKVARSYSPARNCSACQEWQNALAYCSGLLNIFLRHVS